MANPLYLTIEGQQQGLISAGCGSQASIGNKAQAGHGDQIMVQGFSQGMTREQNVQHHLLRITKALDKSSPLLGRAISENEKLSCELHFYRTNRAGVNELYYKIKLTNARISAIETSVPHILNDGAGEPEETVLLTYESITWEHCIAGTSAYSLWEERLF